MNIEVIKNSDWEPEQFTPFDNMYLVFKDKDTNEIIGCGNFQIEKNKNHTYIYVYFIEAYGDGKGKAILNHLLNLNNKIIIEGESYEDLVGFWIKMGAVFYDGLNFVIQKIGDTILKVPLHPVQFL